MPLASSVITKKNYQEILKPVPMSYPRYICSLATPLGSERNMMVREVGGRK